MFFGLALLFDAGFIRVIHSRIRANEYHQKSIDTLEGRRGELTGELAASMKRMSEKAYLDALSAHGVAVPDYFYERLKSTETSNLISPDNVATINHSAIQKSSKTPTEHSTSLKNKAEFCQNCGAKLPADSSCCPKCRGNTISFYL